MSSTTRPILLRPGEKKEIAMGLLEVAEPKPTAAANSAARGRAN
jgi:hypothetical protein